jgi:hypothetical protein
MAHETRRPSRLPDPPCGLSVYRSNADDPGQRVMVTYHGGPQIAIVVDGEDEGEELLVADMSGSFERVK